MATAVMALRQAARELRGSRGRMAFIATALAVGVAAVVAVAGLADGLAVGLRAEARQLLAADLAVEGGRPLPSGLDQAIAELSGARRADTVQLATMAAAPGGGRSQLVELKAVGPGYPFYGALTTVPPLPVEELLAGARVLVAPELLPRLGLEVGDRLRLGHTELEIAGTVLAEPDRVGGLMRGPRVLASLEGLGRAGLEGELSRVRYTALVRLPDGAGLQEVERAAGLIRERLGDSPYLEVETYRDAQPNIREGLRRAERFLGLVALLSLLISSVGVAQAVRAWVAGRLDAIAVRRCLGSRPREVLFLYALQTVAVAVIGSLVGAFAGTALLAAAPALVGSLLPVAGFEPWQPAAVARGLGLGVLVAVLFSVPALLPVLRVPPVRVLRRDAEPVPAPFRVRLAAIAAVLGGAWLAATVQSRSVVAGSLFTAGVVLVAGAAAGAAHLLARVAARVPEVARRYWLRHGLAALARPGGDTLGAMVALALGAAAVLGLHTVEHHLSRELDADLPATSPSTFFVDVQPPQWAELEALLEDEGAVGVDSQPMVMGRLLAVDGVDVVELSAGDDERRRRWALTREQRLTYGPTLPSDNRVVAGALWSFPGQPELSVEEEFARDLGLGVGSRVTFDIQGVPLEFRVGSLRRVEWRTFGINFFLHAAPGSLEAAPQQRLAVARLPAGREHAIQDRVVAAFPNVTVIQVREVLEKVATVLGQAASGVRILGWFTVVAGLAILGGAVSAGEARRGREVAVLKTVGLTRAGVVAVFGVEYLLVGTAAGLIGALAGVAIGWGVTTHLLELTWRWPLLAPAATVVGVGALAVVAGIVASARALGRPPVAVLRSR